MGSHTGQYGNLSTVSSTRAGTDITLPLIDGELSQPSSTIREMLEETCSGKICYNNINSKSLYFLEKNNFVKKKVWILKTKSA